MNLGDFLIRAEEPERSASKLSASLAALKDLIESFGSVAK
jgi:hypothetical protein